jgi:hypothetical protein
LHSEKILDAESAQGYCKDLGNPKETEISVCSKKSRFLIDLTTDSRFFVLHDGRVDTSIAEEYVLGVLSNDPTATGEVLS